MTTNADSWICRIGALFLAAGLLSTAALAQDAPPPAPAAQQPDPGSQSYRERARTKGNVQDLTLRQAIEMALRQNLSIALQNFNFDVNRLQLQSARGFYDPLAGFTAARGSSSSPVFGATSLGASISQTASFGSSLLQNLPTGGSVSVSLSNNRTFVPYTFSSLNPSVGSSLSMSLSQPLWRGLLNSSARHTIKIVQLDAKLTESQFRLSVSQVVQQVHNAYWNLVFTLENYDVARQSRDLAKIQESNNEQRVQSGVLTPVALTSTRAEVGLREQDMIQAEVQIISAENVLKQILAPDPSDALWAQTLLPSDTPTPREMNITLEQALDEALKHRPELEQIRLQLQENAVDRSFYKNQSRPAVNLTVGSGAVGAAGTIFSPPGGPELTTYPAFGGYSTSLGQVFGYDFPNWNVALNVQIPLGNRTLRAQYDQSVVAEQRLETQRKITAQSVMVDVRNAFESVQLQKRAMDSARLSRQLSEEQLTGQTARFEAGFTTNFEVLRYQRDLSDARIRELQAMINYELAVAALQKAMDVIVDANDIQIARPAFRANAPRPPNSPGVSPP